jgi:RNA polymerase sigma-70 factor, ECF subfamily
MPALTLFASHPKAPPDEDARLISEAQRTPAAFQAIYDRWATPVYQYFYYRTGDEPSAEDLTSHLFLSAYQSLPRYVHRGHFAAWLFTIAGNLVKQYYRSRGRETALAEAGDLPSPGDLSADFDQADEIRRLQKLIRALPEDEQELIRLRYVAGLSFVDMAAVLHKREDAVKKSLYRLQARLQSLLEQNND